MIEALKAIREAVAMDEQTLTLLLAILFAAWICAIMPNAQRTLDVATPTLTFLFGVYKGRQGV